MNEVTNILIAGVGGQGTILTSKILGRVALKQSLDVKVSEIHGMAQRGGSVITQVRFGEKVYAPTITPGTVDIILAFEKLEALRWLQYLRGKGTTVIVNNQEIYSLPVLTGSADYPNNVVERVKDKVSDVIVVNAYETALECGDARTVNVVLLGVLAEKMDIGFEIWRETIEEIVPSKAAAVNAAAFEAGTRLATNSEVCR